LRSGYNDLGAEFTVPRKVRTDTIMTAACILPDAQREIESATSPDRLGRPGSREKLHPVEMMERLPQRGN
jgi:hypothetical protein